MKLFDSPLVFLLALVLVGAIVYVGVRSEDYRAPTDSRCTGSQVFC